MIFGSVRSSRNANLRLSVCLSVCLMKVCLELSIFNFLSQVSPRSVPGQSQVSGQSQVLGLSELTSSVRRSLKYLVLLLREEGREEKNLDRKFIRRFLYTSLRECLGLQAYCDCDFSVSPIPLELG